MKALLLVLLAVLAGPAWAGPAAVDLPFNGGTILAHCGWTQGPAMPQESVLQVNWQDAARRLPVAPPGSFKVELVMPDMPEMVNPPTQVTPMVDAHGNAVLGAYVVRNIYFTMGGLWHVNLKLKYPDGHLEAQTITLQLRDQ